MIRVLDRGYVRLVDHMGSDLSVVNAARASFQKESDWDLSPDGPRLRDKDARLIWFLAEHGHTSPFRHAFVTLEVKAPLMVARQWWKYVVGSDHTMDAWNEASRRYITMEPEFYIPEAWREAPKNRKQGSVGPVDAQKSQALSASLAAHVDRSLALYQEALDAGVAPEQARMFLPAYAMYTVWRWSASLQSVAHFLKERLADDAQWEIRQYARAVYELVRPLFPHSLAALLGDGHDPSDGGHTPDGEVAGP
ncbi:MAG: FAD-dependent thymidylate synthase [Clostridia bacterium]|nr:FAD-dependent thymidylate synthase [Clostridia bacterium]